LLMAKLEKKYEMIDDKEACLEDEENVSVKDEEKIEPHDKTVALKDQHLIPKTYIGQMLEHLDLINYEGIFKDKGFESKISLKDLVKSEFDSWGEIKKGHKKQLWDTIETFQIEQKLIAKYFTPNKDEFPITLVTVGFTCVGKSQLLAFYTKGEFAKEYHSTLNVEVYYGKVTRLGRVCALKIVDCPGQEILFDKLPDEVFSQAHAFVAVCSGNDPKSLTELEKKIYSNNT